MHTCVCVDNQFEKNIKIHSAEFKPSLLEFSLLDGQLEL